jgi:hypothetical protein
VPVSFKYGGSLLASFIFFFFSHSSFAYDSTLLIDSALSKKLYHNPVWQSLLHAKDGKSNIFDPNFLLSSDDFTLKHELKKTIHFIFGSNSSAESYCRFPARYLWLSKQLGLPDVDLSKCLAFKEFTEKAPIDDVSLIYASENLVSPSSMMGHIFLKIEGVNAEKKLTEHSLSYFTEVRGINVPKLLFESLVTGKEGYFALNPYVDKLKYYLQEEQRNVWEYHLDFSPFQIQLLQAHLWELKQTKLSYFFDDYNCATFTFYVLSVAESDLLQKLPRVVSPLDVAKAAEQAGLIDEVLLTPSYKWKTRMLQEAVPTKIASQVKHAVDSGNLTSNFLSELNEQDFFLSIELYHSYSKYLYEVGSINKLTMNSLLKQAEKINEVRKADFVIDISNYKNPLKTPADSQLYTGLVNIEGDSLVKVGILPAAKTIEDDNRQFFAETELRIFDLSVLIDIEKRRIRLNEFKLYSVSSLIPYDELTGGISGRFSIGAEDHYNKNLVRGSAFDVSGGLGLSYNLSSDILFYSIIGGGGGYRAGKFYVYSKPEIGFVVDEIFDMKSIVSLNNVWNQDRSKQDYYKFRFNQSAFLSNDIAFFAGYERIWNEDDKQHQFDITLKYYY